MEVPILQIRVKLIYLLPLQRKEILLVLGLEIKLSFSFLENSAFGFQDLVKVVIHVEKDGLNMVHLVYQAQH
jgi:hypothetical protein